MKGTIKFFPAIFIAVLLFLPGGCSCGFNCSGSDNGNGGSNAAVLTLGFSDSLPEDLNKVVIKVTAITFRRSGADDVKVENFTISEQNLTNAADFQVNLLDYTGTEQLTVIKNLRLEPALYDVFIDVVGDNVNNSYVVVKSTNRQEKLKVPNGGRLVLEDLRLTAGAQAFTVEFGLAQSLQFDTEDSYLLTENGIRFENNAVDAQLSGAVDSELFDTVSPCDAKADPQAGNRVYLYQGGDLSSDLLVDVYQADTANTPDPGSVAPFAVASIAFNASTANWEYTFGYLPPGNYTLAFSCNTGDDDPVEWDDLDIPLPDTMKYRVILAEDQIARCELSADIAVNPGNCTRSSR